MNCVIEIIFKSEYPPKSDNVSIIWMRNQLQSVVVNKGVVF